MCRCRAPGEFNCYGGAVLADKSGGSEGSGAKKNKKKAKGRQAKKKEGLIDAASAASGDVKVKGKWRIPRGELCFLRGDEQGRSDYQQRKDDRMNQGGCVLWVGACVCVCCVSCAECGAL